MSCTFKSVCAPCSGYKMGKKPVGKPSMAALEEKDEFKQTSDDNKIVDNKSLYGINIPAHLLRTLIVGLAFASRLSHLTIPSKIVFDEMHFGRFTTFIINETFFFDVHPPFAKLVFALIGYLSGLDGTFHFENIGQDLSPILPQVWYLRLVPATFASLVIPCMYEILIDLGCSAWIASFGAFLAICDNMLIVQSRFILLDAFLHFFTMFSIMAYLKFRKNNKRPFSFFWWAWLLLTGIGLAGAVSTKYSGISVVLLIGGVTAYDLWQMIEDCGISPFTWTLHLLCRLFSLVLVPLTLYLLQFYILVTILINSGPQDDIMSSAFQASLKGGLAKVTKGQAPVVAYGSQVTLRHTHGKQCWLHSHEHVYPVKYPDDRGSSHQQQVTCYPFKDVNNWWIIKNPNTDSLTIQYPPVPVKNGDIIQVIHGTTGRALNSHDVASPLTPQHQEVSCYIDYNISMVAQNMWRLEIINPDAKGEWKALQSQIRLVHVNTSQAVKISGKQLPDWGSHQFEVCTDRFINNDETVWNVEEHQQNITYPEGVNPEDSQEQDNDEGRIVHMPFFDKFKELQFKMLSSDRDTVQKEHAFSSRPHQWPWMKRGVAYWLDEQSNKQVYCFGNPLVWWCSSLAILVYLALLAVYLLRRQRAVYDVNDACWQNYVFCGILLVVGYFVHFLPFFPNEKTLFIYQYLPALLFKILLFAVVVQHLLDIVSCVPLARNVFCLGLVIYSFLVLWTFQYFSPFTYADKHLTSDEIAQHKWLKSWDFLNR